MSLIDWRGCVKKWLGLLGPKAQAFNHPKPDSVNTQECTFTLKRNNKTLTFDAGKSSSVAFASDQIRAFVTDSHCSRDEEWRMLSLDAEWRSKGRAMVVKSRRRWWRKMTIRSLDTKNPGSVRWAFFIFSASKSLKTLPASSPSLLPFVFLLILLRILYLWNTWSYWNSVGRN